MAVLTDTLTLYRGEKKAWEGTLTEDGVAVNITGFSIYFTVRKSVPMGVLTSDGDRNVVMAKSVGSGIALTDPTNGKFEINLTKSDTNSIEIPGAFGSYLTYYYEIAIIAAGDSDPITYASGKLLLYPDIVRAV